MTWNSAAEFVAMGGHGPYVWGSFGVVVAVLFVECLLVTYRRTSAVRSLKQQALAERLEKEGA